MQTIYVKYFVPNDVTYLHQCCALGHRRGVCVYNYSLYIYYDEDYIPFLTDGDPNIAYEPKCARVCVHVSVCLLLAVSDVWHL